MNKPLKQHLIDPEICIRCYTCEMTCPEQAIEHDDNNVVVNADLCNFCMDCIPDCPTGSIDEWRVVDQPYSLDQQYDWEDLPEQEDLGSNAADNGLEALDDAVAKLLTDAHSGAGGKVKAPATAAKPTVNMYNLRKPAIAKVQGKYRLTDDPKHDVRHIILDLGNLPFPVLEGQSVGIIPPGETDDGTPHLPRLYSVSSPRDGERPNFNNLSLTVKRDEGGIASTYLCDLEKGAEVQLTGPFGATFLIPDDPDARLLMICTGTGSAPMRAFTMRRQRTNTVRTGGTTMFFGARSANSLPYFGPLSKVPKDVLDQHLVFSREGGKEYVQDRMLAEASKVTEILNDPNSYIYICGLRDMEDGVETALQKISDANGIDWATLKATMRDSGRFHVETY